MTTTYDVHAHCIPTALIDLLRADGARFGIEIADDGQDESAVLAGRVMTLLSIGYIVGMPYYTILGILNGLAHTGCSAFSALSRASSIWR